MDKIKHILAVLLVVAGIYGFYYLSEHALILRVLAVLAGVVSAFVLFATTPAGHDAIVFTKEAAAETRRVVWPTRKETVQTTAVVFLMVAVMAIFLWIVDVGFLWAVSKLMGRSA